MNTTDTPQIHFVRTGPRGGKPTVFIHAVALDLTYWGGQIEALCDARDLVAYDLPGQGRTPGTPASWTFDAAVATLARVVKATGSEAVHLVGTSVGGMIAQAFALAHPERVRSLVLMSTAASFTQAERESMRQRADLAQRDGMTAVLQSTIERWFKSTTIARRPDIIDRVSKSMLAINPAIYSAMWHMIAGLDFIGRLGEIRCPTLIMTGDLDPICSPAVALALHDRITGSRLEVVPDAAHMCILEQPDFINDRLAAFFSTDLTTVRGDGGRT